MKKTHELKIWPVYFTAVESGKKTFEIRRNDRDFQLGDTISLHEYNPDTKRYTGGNVLRDISYILDDPTVVREGYVILGLQAIKASIAEINFTNTKEKKLFDAIMSVLELTKQSQAYTESAIIHNRLRSTIDNVYGGIKL